jgi:Arc/MetJ family transcription regulator
MRKHTTIDLDMDLIREASTVLGTSRVTDTVHAALDDVVRRRLRMGLVDFTPALDLGDLDVLRMHRFGEPKAPSRPDAANRPRREDKRPD